MCDGVTPIWAFPFVPLRLQDMKAWSELCDSTHTYLRGASTLRHFAQESVMIPRVKKLNNSILVNEFKKFKVKKHLHWFSLILKSHIADISDNFRCLKPYQPTQNHVVLELLVVQSTVRINVTPKTCCCWIVRWKHISWDCCKKTGDFHHYFSLLLHMIQ